MSIFEIVSSRKDFGSRWVGSPRLNELGLHVARMRATDLLLRLRRRQIAPRGATGRELDLLRDGLVVWPKFLPADVFASVRAEARAFMEATERDHPMPRPDAGGFGSKRPFEGGFDRFDGSTLNRFVRVDEQSTPVCLSCVGRDPTLARLFAYSCGLRPRPRRFWLYQTVFGDAREQAQWPDTQADVHRDTFHSTIKLWLALDHVELSQGPFRYAPGSHQLSEPRRRWEHASAIRRATAPRHAKGGSFRITEAEVEAMGCGPVRSFPVAANTLVLADTRGFHARGAANPGARRLAIYTSAPRWPFSPLAL